MTTALAANEEAVGLWRPLAEADPAEHTTDLAHAVDHHAVGLDRGGPR